MNTQNRTRFLPYEPDQPFLLPPDMKDWLPHDHLVFFLMDLVDRLDLGAIYRAYDGSRGGRPPYDPRMMTALLLYAYCQGVPSSRKIERATRENVAFRVLTADQQPDHDTIADFRKRHLAALADLFVQILRLCQKTGLVKLGHVALDGTKVRANASKHKAMSYARMEKSAAQLREEIEALLAEAERTDAEENARHGSERGDELPEKLRHKKHRLAAIERAMNDLENEAQANAQAERERRAREAAKREANGQKRRGKKPKEPDDKPAPKAQRNFTDPDSRIMPASTHKGAFEQAYNCQAAVDAHAQIILATGVTQQANDKNQLKPMLQNLLERLGDDHPPKKLKLSADNGYYSEDNVKLAQAAGLDPHIATDKPKHNQPPPPAPRGRIPKNATIRDRMARKLRTVAGRAVYKARKAIVEPVFGQIKEPRNLRRFSHRGLQNVLAEWDIICLTHNILKLHKAQATR